MTLLHRLAVGAALVLAAAPLFSQPKQEKPEQPFDLSQLLGPEVYTTLENLLVTELPKRLAPAQKWEVKIGRTGNDLAAGKLAKLTVHGVNVQTRDGLTIADAMLSIQDLQLDLKSGSIAAVGKSQFVGRLGADAVTAYAQAGGRGKISDLNIRLDERKMFVHGILHARGFGLPVSVVGQPELDENLVDFRADEVRVADVRVPKGLVRELERHLNPIVDLRGLKIPARLTRVAIDGQQLVAEATLDFSGGLPALGKKRAQSGGGNQPPPPGGGARNPGAPSGNE